MPETIPLNLRPVVDSAAERQAATRIDRISSPRNVKILAQIDAKNIIQAEKALGAISRNASEFEKSMQAANARVLAFGTSVAVIEGMRRSFLSLIKTTAQVESALVKINSIGEEAFKKAGITVQQYGQKLFQVARETGQSFETVADAALEFARQGQGVEEQLKRTRDALILTRLSGLEITKSIEALTSTYNAFKGEVSSTTEILNKLVAVDNKSAASMADLAEGTKRMGFIAKESGQSLDDVVATVAVLEEVTARGGAVIGNAFKTILTRAQSLENIKLFDKLGVNTLDVNGKIRPTLDLLTDLSKIINKPEFSGGNKINILKQLAGNYQINTLAAFNKVVLDIGDSESRLSEVRRISKNATTEAQQQNEKYSQTLESGLNTANVAIQELFNNIGQLGVKDPFSAIVQKVVGFADLVKKSIDSEGLGGDIAKGLIKGVGGILFSNTGLALVGFALIKIVKDFVVFAKEAATGFLAFNKTSKEQERIQSSIANILATERGILDGISNTEQGRVVLAQRVADIYDRQVASAAALKQLTSGASQAVYQQGYRVTEKGITVKGRAAEGYLPSLVQSEMRDVKNGVGGANPNSKIIVMPNFPFGGGKKGLMVANSSERMVRVGDSYAILNPNQTGKRSAEGFLSGDIRRKAGIPEGGQFISPSLIEGNIIKMVNEAIIAGKNLKDLSAVINKTIAVFELNRETFARVSREANAWAQKTFKETVGNTGSFNVSAGQIEAARRSAPSSLIYGNIGSANTSFGGGNLISSEGSLGVLSKASIYKKKNEEQDQKLSALKARLLDVYGEEYATKQKDRQKGFLYFSRGGNAGAGQSAKSTVSVLPEKETQVLKKNFSDISNKLFLAGIAAEGLGSAIDDSNSKLAQFGEVLGKAAFGLYAISQFSQIGGLKTFSFGGGGKTGGFKANLAKGFAAGKAGETLEAGAGLVAGGGRLLGGALRIIPIIGQVAIGLGILYEGLKFFKPNLFEDIRLAFGGLTQSAKEANENFIEFSRSLFDEKGNLKSRNLPDAKKELQSQIEIIRQKADAEGKGIKTNDKNPNEIAAEIFRKKVSENFGKVTFGSANVKSPQFGSATFRSPSSRQFKTFTFADLDKSAQEIVQNAIGRVSLDENSLREALKNKGVKNIGTSDINTAEFSAMQEKFIQLALEFVAKDFNKLNLGGIFSGPSSKLSSPAQLNSLIVKRVGEKGLLESVLKFTGGKPETKSPFRPQETISVEQSKRQLDIFAEQKDLVLSIASERENALKIEQSIGEISAQRNAQLDGEIKRLEFQRKIQSENLAVAKKYLEIFEKEAETANNGRIPQANQDRAKKELDKITSLSSPEEIKNAILAIREALTGTNTIDETAKAVEETVFATKDLQDLNKKRLESEIKINGIIVSGNEAYKERNRLLEVSRELSQSQFNLRDAQRQKLLSAIDARASGVNVSEPQRRNILATKTPIQIVGLQDERKRAEQKLRDDIRAERDAAKIRTKDKGPQAFLEDKSFIDKVKSLRVEFEATITNIDKATAELEDFNKGLGDVETSTTSLINTLDQYVRGLGSQRGQNQFNLLQSTDPNSIAQGLIGEQVYNNSGIQGASLSPDQEAQAQLAKSIAQQNALLNEQFKIKTAASASEKLELERGLELTKEIISIRNAGLDPIREQEALEKAINNNLAKRRTFGAGVDNARSKIQGEIQTFSSDLGETATMGFRDGLVSAMQAATSQAGNLKEALLDAALSFANKLRDAAFNNLANIIVNKTTGSGGIVSSLLGSVFSGAKGKATGGLITGGSGSKDDVPTLLMGGEYVMPKNVVSQYGKGFFDSLRSGSVGKMAQGGYFAPGVRGQGTISGKENLLDFATQTATSGKGDIVSQLSANAAIVSLEPESLRLSNFARFGDSPINQATQEAKDQAFGLYLDQMNAEKEYAAQQEQLRKAEKAKKKEFWTSLAIAAVGAGLSYGVGGGIKTSAPKALNADLPAAYNAQTGLFETIKAYLPKTIPNKGGGFLSSIGSGFGKTVGGIGNFLSLPSRSSNSEVGSIGTLLPQLTKSQIAELEKMNFGGGGSYNPYSVNGKRYNSGGIASGAGDTVPAMLSPKEGVINEAGMRKIGDKGLYALNNGLNPNSNSDLEAKIISKLDELINKTVGSSNINVTVNTGSSSDNSGNDKQDKQGNDQNNQRQLAQRIKETVVSVIREEQRPGGLLTSTRK